MTKLHFIKRALPPLHYKNLINQSLCANKTNILKLIAHYPQAFVHKEALNTQFLTREPNYLP